MSVVTFRRKAVPPSSRRQILFHTDAKVGGKKGFRPSNGAPVFQTQFVIILFLQIDRAFMPLDGWLLVF